MTPAETKKLIEWQDRNRPAMEAHKAGKPVERLLNGVWITAKEPTWNELREYRPKPEPRRAWVHECNHPLATRPLICRKPLICGFCNQPYDEFQQVVKI